MKRIISLLLCLVMVCGMLVSCGETKIGEHLQDYINKFYEAPEEKIELKLYIIYEEADKGALQEVKRRINAHAESTYNTKLTVEYFTEAEYEAKVDAAVAANEKAIVLIHSESLMNKLYNAGKLEELTKYILKTGAEDAKYGLLNAKISSSLIEASKKPIIGNATGAKGLYSIPNNHLIDGTEGYSYIMLNRQACEIWLNKTEAELREIDTQEEIAALKEALVDELGITAAEADEYVKEIKGSYATKAEKEASEEYILNVLSAPQVTAEDAFSGAFAVLKGTDADRAMRIINAINMDADLHNLLQYGIKDTNYNLATDEDGNLIKDEKGVTSVVRITNIEGKKYIMNIRYTGNMFSALYCEDEDWTFEVAKYAESQNNKATLVQ